MKTQSFLLILPQITQTDAYFEQTFNFINIQLFYIKNVIKIGYYNKDIIFAKRET